MNEKKAIENFNLNFVSVFVLVVSFFSVFFTMVSFLYANISVTTDTFFELFGCYSIFSFLSFFYILGYLIIGFLFPLIFAFFVSKKIMSVFE
jgi:hypothetical protein